MYDGTNLSAFRAPPKNIDAEKALLGAIMMNNRSFERVSEFLRPEHFSDPVNAHLYGIAENLLSKGFQVSPVTLKTYCETDEIVKSAGGMGYIAALAGSVVTVINAGDYGKLIYDLAKRRSLIEIGHAIVNDAFETSPDDPADTQIERAEEMLFATAESSDIGGGPIAFAQAGAQALKHAESAMRHTGDCSGVTTGLRDLNGLLGGMHSTDLIVLAARPGMGKTALATHIAVEAARAANSGVVVFYSLEMGSSQLSSRILAHAARVNGHHIHTGRINLEQFTSLNNHLVEMNGLPLLIDDSPSLTMPAIRTRTRRLARKHGSIVAIVVDYLQLICAVTPQREANRVQELSLITRQLKALAKEFNCPVLALSQLSRAVEQRDDKRPRLADLRDSGSIEQDADVVMFIYRDEYYSKDDCSIEDMSVAEIDIAKQRHGPLGVVRCHFDAAHTAFSDLYKG